MKINFAILGNGELPRERRPNTGRQIAEFISMYVHPCRRVVAAEHRLVTCTCLEFDCHVFHPISEAAEIMVHWYADLLMAGLYVCIRTSTPCQVDANRCRIIKRLDDRRCSPCSLRVVCKCVLLGSEGSVDGSCSRIAVR